MSVKRRVKTVHEPGEGGWRCDGIAIWGQDPFLDEVYAAEEFGWWCECEHRMRHDEV